MEKEFVSVDVKNVGGERGSYTVELRFAWGVDDTHEVTLNPGESTKVTFSFTVEEPGTYHPKIGDLSGSFEVKPILEIVDYLRYLKVPDGLDYVWISGMIKNNSSKPITPQVQVKYYDQEEFVIDTDRLSYPLTIAPDKRFPFRTRRIRAEVNEVADYELNSSFFVSQGNYLEDIVVISQSVEQNGLYDKYTVTVELQNKTDETADSVYVQVAFYDEKGENRSGFV